MPSIHSIIHFVKLYDSIRRYAKSVELRHGKPESGSVDSASILFCRPHYLALNTAIINERKRHGLYGKVGAQRRPVAGQRIHVDGYPFQNEQELRVYWGLLKMVKDSISRRFG